MTSFFGSPAAWPLVLISAGLDASAGGRAATWISFDGAVVAGVDSLGEAAVCVRFAIRSASPSLVVERSAARAVVVAGAVVMTIGAACGASAGAVTGAGMTPAA